MPRSSSRVTATRPGQRAGRDRDDAQPVVARAREAGLDGGAAPVQRHDARRGLDGVARIQDSAYRPLRDEKSTVGGQQHRQPPAHEIKGNLVALVRGVDGGDRELAQRLIQRARVARFVGRIQERQPPDPFARLAVAVDGALKRQAPFRQRAGFVTAQQGHAPQVLDRRQSPHDDLLGRHTGRPASQVDHYDGRQKLRRQTDGQRQREHQRFQHRPLEVDVHREDPQHQQQRQLHQQVAEAAQAVLEVGLRRLRCQARGDPPHLGAGARPHDQDPRGAADDVRPRNTAPLRRASGVSAGVGAAPFSAGSLSPVSGASETKRSRASGCARRRGRCGPRPAARHLRAPRRQMRFRRPSRRATRAPGSRPEPSVA